MFFAPERISAVSSLGSFLRTYTSGMWENDPNADIMEELKVAIVKSHRDNGWFTPDNIQFALKSWGDALTDEALQEWSKREGGAAEVAPKRVGIVMAGNIPLVGLHDFLATFLSGHFAMVKLSSDDAHLIPVLAKVLLRSSALFEGDFVFTEQLTDMGAVIATGSDNTARYFHHYFDKYPNIIRKNRTSVAVMTGDETEEELRAFGADIFTYFGLGCRNISHVLLPQDFDIQRIFGAIVDHSEVGNNNKYGNNYDYYRAIYLLNQEDFLENGFFIMKESDVLHTPVAVLNYSRYETPTDAAAAIANWGDGVQCIVGHGHIPFGAAQTPALWDYADGVNTMEFLKNL